MTTQKSPFLSHRKLRHVRTSEMKEKKTKEVSVMIMVLTLKGTWMSFSVVLLNLSRIVPLNSQWPFPFKSSSIIFLLYDLCSWKSIKWPRIQSRTYWRLPAIYHSETLVRHLQDAWVGLEFWNSWGPEYLPDGLTQNGVPLVAPCFHRTQIPQQIPFSLYFRCAGVEITVVHIHSICWWKDAL